MLIFSALFPHEFRKMNFKQSSKHDKGQWVVSLKNTQTKNVKKSQEDVLYTCFPKIKCTK